MDTSSPAGITKPIMDNEGGKDEINAMDPYFKNAPNREGAIHTFFKTSSMPIPAPSSVITHVLSRHQDPCEILLDHF